jgi:hypothetical protein
MSHKSLIRVGSSFLSFSDIREKERESKRAKE